MTHAFSANLKLPLWLNEGIAMVTVDKYFGRSTVKSNTLQSLNPNRRRRSVVNYRNLSEMKRENIIYAYVRGYWIVRFLMDMCPGLLNDLMKKKQSHRAIEKKIASALNISRKAFCDEIDCAVVDYFKNRLGIDEQDTVSNGN